MPDADSGESAGNRGSNDVDGSNDAGESDDAGGSDDAGRRDVADGSDAATTNSDGVVAWSVAPTDTLAGRCLAYALVSVFGGVVLLVAGLAVLFVGVAVSKGAFGSLALFALFVLVGGPLSVVALAPFLDRDQRPDLPGVLGRIHARDLHPLAIAASAILGTTVIVTTFAIGTRLAWPAYVGAMFLALFGLELAAPAGAVDRDAGTLTVHERTHDLTELTSIRPIELGGLVLVRPRFVTRPGGRDAPFLFAMPADAYDHVADAFERGIAADADAPDATSSTDGAAILYWVGSLPAIFGVLFLALAAKRSP